MTKFVKLATVTEIVMGQAPSSNDCNKDGTGTPFVKAGEFGLSRPLIKEWTTNPLKFAKYDDVLLCVVGATCGKINKGFDGAIGRSVAAVRAKPESIDKNYLYYFLQTWSLRLRAMSQGAAQTVITRDMIGNLEIPLPRIEEQRRIASILDKADELRQKRQQAIEKLDQLLQATFIDMFGDPVSNPKGWNLGKLGDVIHSAKDGPHVSPSYSETGIPFLSTRHVRAGKIVWDDLKFITEEDAQIHWKKCKPTRGDILYTKGGTTGLAAVVDTDLDFAVWVHVALLKTNHDKVRSEWLVSMLNTQYCYEQSQRYTHGIANRDLGLKRMVNIEMYIPPLDEQDKFVNFKNKLLKNNLLFESSYSSLEQLFKSLQNQAFNGTL
ncbi:restriction endonuclease subunit S [Acinetobacter sp. C_4_1]|uniref:restriction endonuclease subunit S n=1 Tax=unclassified Acinetobacter TaxID=196816 RepID=UPI0021B83CFE|nr:MULTISPECIES: restriction endonuclease subunit S [unclassified Acinetobacter]MCT8088722.1 restriction endonuclease subunit S [Acinetobacter sp. F_3_1]MCT8096878.1 restriction endonuclease subunit S [Acinetobacter sp. C_3_1]MCT8099753.1 restriction endonuclease subunit S [Acinetobacter sp. C_4_1]MCT8133721.1 restriction endonuclease subunit S [Acinetobacter sp. T_3_1]